MEKLTFIIELDRVQKDFDPNLFARTIAFRAFNWCERVRIEKNGMEPVEMSRKISKG
jgi:hypothetical protein